MRALIFPRCGYVPDALAEQLCRAGHDVLGWDGDDEWAPVLAAATAVFHVLHGHEEHARQTVLQLLRRQAGPASEAVTFVGISTPLTWAGAAPAPLADGAEQQQAAALPAVLTDSDAPARRPAPCAAATHALEQLLLSSSRPGVLRCYVVCPGLLYGRGEEALLPLFRAAWEGAEPLPLFGPGTNLLPTLHVCDLAAYAEAVATQQPGGSAYLLAADEAPISQAALVNALGQLLGQPQAQQCSTDDEGGHTPLGQLLQLHLPFAPSPLPQPGLLVRTCPAGLLASLPHVLGELRQAAGLAPLRILLRGPPAAGKSHLAARLASLYGLRVISMAAILAELPLMDADTQKAAAAQLAGKEGRLSHGLMARLARHLLARLPDAAKQGWVLDGWPRSLAAARALLCTGSPAAADGLEAEASERWLRAPSEGGGGGRRDSTAGGTAAAKDKKKAAATGSAAANSSTSGGSTKEGGSSGAPGGAARARRGAAAGAGAGEDDGSGLDGKARCNPELLPHFVIELDVPEEEALRRVRALVAAEAAAKAAGAAAPGKAAGGGSDAAAAAARKPASAAGRKEGSVAGAAAVALPPPRASEADWQREAEAYRCLMAEEAAELAAARRAAVLAADVQGTTGAAMHRRCDSSASVSSSSSSAGPGGGEVASASAAEVLQLQGCVPQLPEHGSFVAFFLEAGAKYARFSNPYDASVAAAVPATAAAAVLAGEQQQQQQQQCGDVQLPELPALEQQLKQLLGPPRNFRGFPPAAPAAADSSGALAGAEAGADGAAPGTAAGTGGPGMAELLAAAEVLSQERQQHEAARLAAAAQPLVSSLMGGVMQAVMAGLVKVALTRPTNPCEVIAHELLAAAAAQQASYAHPYDAPTYALQEAKVAAKAARDEARAAAAAAKAAREQAAAEQEAAAAECAGSSSGACLTAAAGAGALAGSSAPAPATAAAAPADAAPSSCQASARPALAAAGKGGHKPAAAAAGRASTVAQAAARGGTKPPAVGAH